MQQAGRLRRGAVGKVQLLRGKGAADGALAAFPLGYDVPCPFQKADLSAAEIVEGVPQGKLGAAVQVAVQLLLAVGGAHGGQIQDQHPRLCHGATGGAQRPVIFAQMLAVAVDAARQADVGDGGAAVARAQVGVVQGGDIFQRHHAGIQPHGAAVLREQVREHEQAEGLFFGGGKGGDAALVAEPVGIEKAKGKIRPAVQHGAQLQPVLLDQPAGEHHHVVPPLERGGVRHRTQGRRRQGDAARIRRHEQGDGAAAEGGQGGKGRLRVFKHRRAPFADRIALLLHEPGEIDAEQPLAEVPGGAHRLPAVPVGGHVSPLVKAAEDGKQPFTIGKEQLPPHDEHVAAVKIVAVEIALGGRIIVRIFAADDLHHRVEVADVQCIGALPLPVHGIEIIIDGLGHGHVVLPHDLLDLGNVGKAQLRRRAGVEVGAAHRARVAPLDGVVEFKIAAVMAEAVIVGVVVLPRPILREELAILVGVRRHEPVFGGAVHQKADDRLLLHGNEHLVLYGSTVFMAGYVNFDAPVAPSALHRYGSFGGRHAALYSIIYYIRNAA